MGYRRSASPPRANAAIRLVMFAIALNGDRARQRLRQLGVTDAELEGIFSGSEHELAEARQLNIAAALMTRERLGALLRARIAEVALEARSGRELAALARALEQLPDWALDGADDEYWDTASRDPEPTRAEAPAPVAAAADPSAPVAVGREPADTGTPAPVGRASRPPSSVEQASALAMGVGATPAAEPTPSSRRPGSAAGRSGTWGTSGSP